MANDSVSVISMRAAAFADAHVIRHTAAEVVQRPEFQLQQEVNPRSKIIAWLLDLLDLILTPMFHFFAGLWDMSPLLAVAVVILLGMVLVMLLAHIAYTFHQAMQKRTKTASLGALATKTLDPRSLEIEAEEAAHHQDYIRAVRLLFRASLLRLEQADRRGIRPGITNREYLRRFRDTAAHDTLQMFVDIIDAKWYGYGTCDVRDYMKCQWAHDQISSASGGTSHAHGA
jgi:hypothetical protein